MRRRKKRKVFKWASGHYIKYYVLYLPKHPFCRCDGTFLEHRLIMEKHLGRYLKPNEIIHHIDGDGLNNHLDNLQLFQNHKEHMNGHSLGRFKKGHTPWNKAEPYFIICKICKKKFKIRPCLKDYRKTCSIKCKNKYITLLQKDKPFWCGK